MVTYYVFRDGPGGPIVNGMDAASIEDAQAFADKHMTPGVVACRVDVRSAEYIEYETRLRYGQDYDR